MTPADAPTLFVIPRDDTLRRKTMRGARRRPGLNCRSYFSDQKIKRYPREE
jgi:hypothetical protein